MQNGSFFNTYFSHCSGSSGEIWRWIFGKIPGGIPKRIAKYIRWGPPWVVFDGIIEGTPSWIPDKISGRISEKML